jgi:hypothetical protein
MLFLDADCLEKGSQNSAELLQNVHLAANPSFACASKFRL